MSPAEIVQGMAARHRIAAVFLEAEAGESRVLVSLRATVQEPGREVGTVLKNCGSCAEAITWMQANSDFIRAERHRLLQHLMTTDEGAPPVRNNKDSA
jgi:hypothetical protein